MVEASEAVAAFFDDLDQELSFEGYRLVPWLSWDEWDSVRESLFSSSADEVGFALQRISTWRSRGCLPAAVDVTASIIEIQQKDGFINREKQPVDTLHSENLLQMLYCMAILRLVNCVIEKTRRRKEVSIAEAAEAIGMPRKLVDLRHEGSHRELPALSVLRNAADEAIDWLKAYYWEPQKRQLPFKKDDTANIRREIKSKIRKLALCLQLRHNPASPLVKEKCSKRRIDKILKVLVELYSSFSFEIISVLLEFMLKALDSLNCVELEESNFRGVLDEWGLVIIRFSNKEPEILLMLLEAVLDMIGDGFHRYETGHMTSKSEKASQVEELPLLFAWLVGHFKGLRHLLPDIPLRTRTEFLHKCLLLATYSGNPLMESALQLSELLGGLKWKQRLEKLASLHSTTLSGFQHESSPAIDTFMAQEERIDDAMRKLGVIKCQVLEKKSTHAKGSNTKAPARWVRAKTWNPCPIGMLPRSLGSSGRVPVLDPTENRQYVEQDIFKERTHELKQCCRKRGADCGTEQLKKSGAKQARQRVENHETVVKYDSSIQGCKVASAIDPSMKARRQEECDTENQDQSLIEDRDCLLIHGLWRRVHKKELSEIKSRVRILI